MPPNTASFQAHFHQRWKHLNDPHVRSLAWLLDAPDLLDPDAPQWQGKVATLGPMTPQTREWLAMLDQYPAALHAYLTTQPYTRLGRYAEKLMAFYFEQHHMLVAHGVQVRDASGTIGEFDFLLKCGEELLHWEFASKFYLLESFVGPESADRFVGPNLADTLGLKVRKIMEQQLRLSQHPAAQIYLPQPVTRAQALVKGWLFYYGDTPTPATVPGLSMPHCRGFWSPLAELEKIEGTRFLLLPRLSWLAPVKASADQAMSRATITKRLREHFVSDAMPVLVAILDEEGEETDRGFIVPDDWATRAEARARRMMVMR